MKKKLFIICYFLGVGCVVSQTLTPEQLQQDFTIFKHSIQDIHPGLYWYSDTAEIAMRFQSVEQQLQDEMELKDFYAALQKFYAGIRCGHSWMSMPWEWRGPTDDGPYRIPINFYIEEDRMVVMRDLTDEESIGEGHELISINGVKTKQLINSLIQYTPTDGYAKSRQIRLLAGNFSRYYQVHYGMDSLFSIVLSKEGKPTEYLLMGLPNAEANKRSLSRYGSVEKDEQMLAFQMLQDTIAYLRISSFDKEEIKDGNQHFKSFLKRTFSTVNKNGADRMIIDLRGNPGGEDHYGATLARYLLNRPFRYYLRMEAATKRFEYNEYSYQKGFNTIGKLLKRDKEKPGAYTYNLSRQLKVQKPVREPYRGEIIVLIDGGTFSAASEIASILHTNKRAKFIGTETGGGYYGNNSAMMYGIELPNSRINYYLPVIRYYVAVDYASFQGRGVIPDIEIPSTYENYLSQEDEVLIRALEEIN